LDKNDNLAHIRLTDGDLALRDLKYDSLLTAAPATLTIGKVELIPQYPKNEFAQKSANHTDWTELAIDSIECAGFDMARLVNDKILAIDSVSLASARVASYKNRKVYQKPAVKLMAWQTLQNLPLKLDIRILAFAGVDVRYDELAADGDAPGVMEITGGKGTIKNLTNIVEEHDRFFTVDVSALLMHSGHMVATCRFPVNPADDYWEITGRVGRTDMTAFNRVLTPLMHVDVKSGVIQSLDYHLTGTLAHSHIRLTMAYNDLDVALLKKHDHKHERGFLTFLADRVLVRNDNPGRNGKLRESEGNHNRDPYRSMYNYIWRSFVPAIVKTVI
jgi:hypothetical protein